MAVFPDLSSIFYCRSLLRYPPRWSRRSAFRCADRSLIVLNQQLGEGEVPPDKRGSLLANKTDGQKTSCYLSPRKTGNTEWRGSGMGRSPLAARHSIAFSTSVSAASATEKSSVADSFARGEFLALA